CLCVGALAGACVCVWRGGDVWAASPGRSTLRTDESPWLFYGSHRSTRTHTHTHTHTHSHIHTDINTHTHTPTHKHTHMHTLTYACTHTQTHRNTHTQIHSHKSVKYFQAINVLSLSFSHTYSMIGTFQHFSQKHVHTYTHTPPP